MWEVYLPEYYVERVFRPEQQEVERKAARKARIGRVDGFRARLARRLVELSLCLDQDAAEAELVGTRSRSPGSSSVSRAPNQRR
jgi:hypothetical protein